VFLVWLAVMAGAVVTAASPHWRYARSEVGVGVGTSMLLALEVIARLAAMQLIGIGLTLEQLATTLAVSDIKLTSILKDLRAGKFIVPTEDGRWVVSRDLERKPLADLVHHFSLGLNMDICDDDLKSSNLGKRIGQYLRNAAASERTLLSVTLARILATSEEATQA
jgi:membrane protein